MDSWENRVSDRHFCVEAEFFFWGGGSSVKMQDLNFLKGGKKGRSEARSLKYDTPPTDGISVSKQVTRCFLLISNASHMQEDLNCSDTGALKFIFKDDRKISI